MESNLSLSQLLLQSHSSNSSIGLRYITYDEDWFGSDEIDMLIGFNKNIRWDINNNNSSYSSGIAYSETFKRILGTEDSDLINLRWIPSSENILLLFEEKD